MPAIQCSGWGHTQLRCAGTMQWSGSLLHGSVIGGHMLVAVLPAPHSVRVTWYTAHATYGLEGHVVPGH